MLPIRSVELASIVTEQIIVHALCQISATGGLNILASNGAVVRHALMVKFTSSAKVSARLFDNGVF